MSFLIFQVCVNLLLNSTIILIKSAVIMCSSTALNIWAFDMFRSIVKFFFSGFPKFTITADFA